MIDYDKCKGCGRCIGACSFDAVYNPNSSANELLDRKMAEYAQAVCHGRPHFHIALVQDISPNCDCHGENDAPILPDIGMFASFDPVALDQACADACLKATPIADSQLGEHLAERDGIATMIISRIPIQILNGRQLWIRLRRSVLEQESMS